METSQEQNILNPTNQNLASKPETEDSIIRLSSSSSSSSSCSSIEAEPKPYQNLSSVDQSPPLQIMERDTNNETTTTSNPNTPSYKLPSHVFERNNSKTPVEWSTLSNESLFSIRMGNNSFSGDDYVKSGELVFPQPPSPITPPFLSPLPSPHYRTNQGGGEEGNKVVKEAKTPVELAKKSPETEKACEASQVKEQKAPASIRDVVMANKENNKNNKLDRSASRLSENLSVKSFAFPILGNADKGGLQSSAAPKKKQRNPSQSETPKISSDSEGDERLKKEEATKSLNPKAEAADGVPNRNPKWLSCFPCCTTSCV